MKLIVVSFSFCQGGAAIAAKKFANLARSFSDVDLVPADSSEDNKSRAFPSRVLYLLHFLKRVISYSLIKLMSDDNPAKQSINMFSSRSVLKRIKREEKSAIFNFHWINNDTLSVLKFSRIPKFSIVTLHDEWFYCGAEHYYKVESEYGSEEFCKGYSLLSTSPRGVNWNFFVWKFKLRGLKNRSDIFFTVPSTWMYSRAIRSEILHDKDIRLIPNPIDTDIFSPMGEVERIDNRNKLGFSNDDFVICMGAVDGGKNPIKGFDLLEKSLDRLSQHSDESMVRDVCLLFFGGDYGFVSSFCGFKVVNVGRVSEVEKMRIIYSVSELCLVPSKVESFGQVAAESLACGTPVIAFRTSGLKDIVSDGESGYLANPFSYESYFECIVKMLKTSSADRRLMGYNGRQHILNSFSSEVVGDIYRNLVNEAFTKREKISIKGEGHE